MLSATDRRSYFKELEHPKKKSPQRSFLSAVVSTGASGWDKGRGLKSEGEACVIQMKIYSYKYQE